MADCFLTKSQLSRPWGSFVCALSAFRQTCRGPLEAGIDLRSEREAWCCSLPPIRALPFEDAVVLVDIGLPHYGVRLQSLIMGTVHLARNDRLEEEEALTFLRMEGLSPDDLQGCRTLASLGVLLTQEFQRILGHHPYFVNLVGTDLCPHCRVRFR